VNTSFALFDPNDFARDELDFTDMFFGLFEGKAIGPGQGA
jgi:hypothetical protein